MRNKEYFNVMVLLFVAVIWGSGFPVTDIALDKIGSPYHVVFYRFTIATVAMFLISYKTVIKHFKSNFKGGVIVGLFLFLGFLFQTTGLEYTTPSINAFLTALNVIIAPFLFWIVTKQRVDKYTVVGAFMALVGIAFLTINGSLAIGRGDLLTIICAFFFACHIVANGVFASKKETNLVTLVFLQLFIAMILSGISVLFTTPITAMPSTSGIMAVAYLGLLSTLLCFFLQTYAQERVDSTKTAIILSTESLWGTVFSIILVNDILTIRIVIGAIILFSAIIITETKLSFIKKR